MSLIGRFIGIALAIVVLGGVAWGRSERRNVDTTVRITVRTDGGNVGGEITGWDDAGAWIETRSEGEIKVAWADFGSKRAYDVRRRVMDDTGWKGWARIGALMLGLDDERLAERAFAVALKKESGAKQTILKMRSAHMRGGDVYAMLDDAGDASEENKPAAGERESESKHTDRRKRGPDEREAAGGAREWETLSEAQHTKETERLRRVAQGMLMMGGLDIEAIETDHFLLYSDLQASETKKWAGKLDTMYQTLLATLEIPEGTRMFRGRCVVFIFKEREDFIGFEAAAFGYNATNVGGLFHPRGKDAFIVFYKGRRADQDFQSVLVHEAVHGFMYRYRTPKRLPTWANEGLADYVAGHLTPRSTEPQRHWQHARNFINRGGDTGVIMSQSYRGQGENKWPGDDSYPVSHMLVRFMLKHRAPAFKQWIDDMKAGVQWEEAMGARFGVTRDVLAEGFAKEMKGEKRYTRLR